MRKWLKPSRAKTILSKTKQDRYPEKQSLEIQLPTRKHRGSNNKCGNPNRQF